MKENTIKKYLNAFFYIFSFIFTYYLLICSAEHTTLSYLLVLTVISIDIAMYIADEYERIIVKEKQKLAVYLKDLDNQKENIEIIKQRNLETERKNHDLKKNISIVKAFLEHGQYSEAEEYVSKLQEKCGSFFSYKLYSNHPVINALLNSKLEVCKTNGIDVKCFVCGKIDGVDDVELYCLLVNLLDNAIAAAMLSEKPYISIFLNSSDTQIYGEFINSIKSTECSTFEELIPEVAEVGHGYGLQNIREIIEINGGRIEFLLISSGMIKVTFKINKKMYISQ